MSEPMRWGRYVTIQWQDGPVERCGENGALLADVIACCIARLCTLQEQWPSAENLSTLTALGDALEWQSRRRDVRLAAGGAEGRGLGWESV